MFGAIAVFFVTLRFSPISPNAKSLNFILRNHKVSHNTSI